MLYQIPELFDRKFAIGFFLPATIFILVSLGTISLYQPQSGGPTSGTTVTRDWLSLLNDPNTESLISASLLVLGAWLLATLLAALNREIIRFLEGYGRLNPLSPFRRLECWRFRRLQASLQKLDQHISRP